MTRIQPTVFSLVVAAVTFCGPRIASADFGGSNNGYDDAGTKLLAQAMKYDGEWAETGDPDDHSRSQVLAIAAADSFIKEIAADSNNPRLWMGLVFALRIEGRYDQADVVLRRGLQLFPDYSGLKTLSGT